MHTARAALVMALFVAAYGCGSTATPTEDPSSLPLPPIDTGRSCATATAQCGKGRCVAHVENRCRQSLKCHLNISALCSAFTGETGEGRGAGENQIPAGAAGDIEAEVMCTANEIDATQVKGVSCLE